MADPRWSDVLTILVEDPKLGLTPHEFLGRSAATQKVRLMEAVTVLVSEKGYAKASVDDICAMAGVSRTTFYKHFEGGKEQCLIEADRALARIHLGLISKAALASAGDGWEAALAAGIRAGIDAIREHPAIARAQFVEVFGIGPRAIEIRRESRERFETQLEALLSRLATLDPTTPKPDLQCIRLIMAGVDALITQALSSNQMDQLDTIADIAIASYHAICLAAQPDGQPHARPGRHRES
jgi:AcrR family transcriptional regulator